VVAALKSMRPTTTSRLIVGGMDRQLNTTSRRVPVQRCRSVVAHPGASNGATIGRGYAESIRRPRRSWRLDEAVRVAAAFPDVDVVLLSPGAASYDCS